MELHHDFSGPSELHAARTWTLACCELLACGAISGDAQLVVDELVTNAFLHARSRASVSLYRDDDCLGGSVTDFGGGHIERRPLEGDQRDGWGLNIIKKCVDSLVVDYHPGGKTVVFSIRCPPTWPSS